MPRPAGLRDLHRRRRPDHGGVLGRRLEGRRLQGRPVRGRTCGESSVDFTAWLLDEAGVVVAPARATARVKRATSACPSPSPTAASMRAASGSARRWSARVTRPWEMAGRIAGDPLRWTGMRSTPWTDARRADGGPATTPARDRPTRSSSSSCASSAWSGWCWSAWPSTGRWSRPSVGGGAAPAGRDRRAEVLDVMVQRRARPDAGTFIGKGKAKELAATVKALGPTP